MKLNSTHGFISFLFSAVGCLRIAKVHLQLIKPLHVISHVEIFWLNQLTSVRHWIRTKLTRVRNVKTVLRSDVVNCRRTTAKRGWLIMLLWRKESTNGFSLFIDTKHRNYTIKYSVQEFNTHCVCVIRGKYLSVSPLDVFLLSFMSLCTQCSIPDYTLSVF
jgi:hypothetical protein